MEAVAGEDEELSTVLVPAEILAVSPSAKDGVSGEAEKRHRAFGCELIQEAGILLSLPQVVMVTAQNMLHRFYYRQPLTRFDALSVAMGCTLLSSKIEEKPKMVRDVVFIFYFIYHVRRQTPEPRQLDLGGPVYTAWKNEVVNMERCVLKELGFSLYRIMDHPHKYILYYIKILDGSEALAQAAWNYLNDSMRLDLCLRHPARTLACAAIYLAARRIGFPLPHDGALSAPWHALMHTSLDTLHAVASEILSLYHLDKLQWLPPLADCDYLAD